MPERTCFDSVEEYYSTLFHELTHSTGHSTRLNRSTFTDFERFGDHNYSREELVAEMGAAFLAAYCGISCGVLRHRESNHQQQCGISGELAGCTEERLSPGARRGQSSSEGRGSDSRCHPPMTLSSHRFPNPCWECSFPQTFPQTLRRSNGEHGCPSVLRAAQSVRKSSNRRVFAQGADDV
jgi:hypothetical protein